MDPFEYLYFFVFYLAVPKRDFPFPGLEWERRTPASVGSGQFMAWCWELGLSLQLSHLIHAGSQQKILPDRTSSRLIGDLDKGLDVAFICSPWSILVDVLKAPRKEINCLLFL